MNYFYLIVSIGGIVKSDKNTKISKLLIVIEKYNMIGIKLCKYGLNLSSKIFSKSNIYDLFSCLRIFVKLLIKFILLSRFSWKIFLYNI